MTDWRTDKPPMDGTPIYIRVIQPYRYLPYKPNSQQFKRGEKGRWQAMNEYGGWDNCPHPLGNEWSRESPFDSATASTPIKLSSPSPDRSIIKVESAIDGGGV